MQTSLKVSALSGLALCAALAFAPAATAQNSSFLGHRIDDSQRIVLPGNLSSMALSYSLDRGSVPAAQPVQHLLLQLQRPPAEQAAMTAYITQVADASSPIYHKWLSAQKVGQLYGPAHEDITEVVIWLASKGLTINMVYPTGMVIDFSGTPAQVDAAFHLGLRTHVVDGETQVASTRRPTIPTALARIIGGIVTPGDLSAQTLTHTAHSARVTTPRYAQAQPNSPPDVMLAVNTATE